MFIHTYVTVTVPVCMCLVLLSMSQLYIHKPIDSIYVTT